MKRGIFSFGNGCHGNQENGVFAVSMATIVKGKKFLCLFQKANVGKYSLRVSFQSNHYFTTCPIVPHY